MKWLVIPFALLVGLYGFYKLAYPSTVVRYRTTVEVETPRGLAQGSAVNEIYFYSQPLILAEGLIGRGARLSGQAVEVDLGDRGTLFGLLTGSSQNGLPGDPTPEAVVLDLFAPGWRNGTSGYHQAIRSLSESRKVVAVPKKYLPFFVRFRNLKDPRTVERVDPNDMVQSFGEGVRLARVKMELVDSGIWPFNWLGMSGVLGTTGIEKSLPWLNSLRGGYLHGGFTSRDAPLGLHAGYFLKE